MTIQEFIDRVTAHQAGRTDEVLNSRKVLIDTGKDIGRWKKIKEISVDYEGDLIIEIE